MASKLLSSTLGISFSKPLRVCRNENERCVVYLKDVLNKSETGYSSQIQTTPQILCQTVLKCSKDKRYCVVRHSQPHIMIEFGSPNVAKPFHPGNFRSTLLGSTISRLFTLHGHEVTRVNYLGNWGDQFNMLLTFLKRTYGSVNVSKKMDSLDIHDLLRLYAQANDLHGKDEIFQGDCLQTKTSLETGDENDLKLWQEICDKTAGYHSEINRKFNIDYESVVGESDYRESAVQLSQQMLSLFPCTKGAVEYTIPFNIGKQTATKIPYATVDNELRLFSTYLSRDIAAANDRILRYPDLARIHYVVEKGQHLHFRKLNFFMNHLRHENQIKFVHTEFGRVVGMSSRRNTALSIDSLLEDAKDLVVERMRLIETTKSDPENFHQVAEQLAIASLVINCISYKRTSDYKFNWDQVVSVKGKSAVYIMMTYAKVCSIFREMKLNPDTDDISFCFDSFESDENAQIKSAVLDLMVTLANYERVLFECYESLDPYKLKDFIYDVCKLLTKLHKTALCVSETCSIKQSNRLAAFQAGLRVLKHALSVLGVTPLEKI